MQSSSRAESRARITRASSARSPSLSRAAARSPSRSHSLRPADLLRAAPLAAAYFLAAATLRVHPGLPLPLLAFPALAVPAALLALLRLPLLRAAFRHARPHLPALVALHAAHLALLLPSLRLVGPSRALLSLGAPPALRVLPRTRRVFFRFALALVALFLLAHDASGGGAPPAVLRSRAARAVHAKLSTLSRRYRPPKAPLDPPLPPAAPRRRLLAILNDTKANASVVHANETLPDAPPASNVTQPLQQSTDAVQLTDAPQEERRSFASAFLGVSLAAVAALLSALATDLAQTSSRDVADTLALHALVFSGCACLLLPFYIVCLVRAHTLVADYAGSILTGILPRSSLFGSVLLLAPLVLPSAPMRRSTVAPGRSLSRGGAPGTSGSLAASLARVELAVARGIPVYPLVLVSVVVVRRLSTSAFGFTEPLTFSSFTAAVVLLGVALLEPPPASKPASRYDPSRMERRLSSGSGDLSVLMGKPASQHLRHFFKAVNTSIALWFGRTRDLLSHAKSNKASWQILNFLVLQSGMAVVELVYASLWHSTGLISISADNFFCSVALAVGLLAIRVTTRKPSSTHTYGFSRFESVCGFANGIMLVYVAVLVVLEAFERLHDAENVAAGHAFAVCLFGMTGNVLGLYFFPPETRRENHNVQGIYLHIWANTLAFASLAVSTAISTAVPTWKLIDLVTSTLVGVGIIAFAIPLIVRSARLLLLLVPVEKKKAVESVRSRLNNIDGVVQVDGFRVWNLTPTCLFASVRIGVSHGHKGQDVDILYKARSAFAGIGVPASQCTIQISRVESEIPAIVFFHKRTRSGFGDTGIDLEGLTAVREQSEKSGSTRSILNAIQ